MNYISNIRKFDVDVLRWAVDFDRDGKPVESDIEIGINGVIKLAKERSLFGVLGAIIESGELYSLTAAEGYLLDNLVLIESEEVKGGQGDKTWRYCYDSRFYHTRMDLQYRPSNLARLILSGEVVINDNIADIFVMDSQYVIRHEYYRLSPSVLARARLLDA